VLITLFYFNSSFYPELLSSAFSYVFSVDVFYREAVFSAYVLLVSRPLPVCSFVIVRGVHKNENERSA
jgi:hypothetical protein